MNNASPTDKDVIERAETYLRDLEEREAARVRGVLADASYAGKRFVTIGSDRQSAGAYVVFVMTATAIANELRGVVVDMRFHSYSAREGHDEHGMVTFELKPPRRGG